MSKTLVGPRLRRLRMDRKQTQAQMAETLGLSPSYINLLENNQRSLSVKVLMSISDVYGIDWRELTRDEGAKRLGELRAVVQDPIFGSDKPDLEEFRSAIDHSPVLVEKFLHLYRSHRAALEKVMKISDSGIEENLLQSSPEAVIHDYFRSHSNYFPQLEAAAEAARAAWPCRPEDHFTTLKARLARDHNLTVQVRSLDEMAGTLRDYDSAGGIVHLSQALNMTNKVFQLAHVLALAQHSDLLDDMVKTSGIKSPQALARLQVELANYFAAAYLMPYTDFLQTAQAARYDLDRIGTAFAVSFEQVCQRLTTMQRDGARGVPFFFLRIDRAGNVTKRFNATAFHLAEYGGACPVWNIHTAFYSPGVIHPQFVEMPDGARFFTISRTVHRPVFDWETQDRRLTLALGCDFAHADQIGYSVKYNFDDPNLFSPIGLNCHLCPRMACSQRAHQPLFVDLPIDANRRGTTRYES